LLVLWWIDCKEKEDTDDGLSLALAPMASTCFCKTPWVIRSTIMHKVSTVNIIERRIKSLDIQVFVNLNNNTHLIFSFI
jgi:hypothetical protein